MQGDRIQDYETMKYIMFADFGESLTDHKPCRNR
jgi:hypothetical protein